jgi:ribonuclease BN (tRNA processing enzyme)
MLKSPPESKGKRKKGFWKFMIPNRTINITFLGTGDAFGHGGRLQPCILVETPRSRCLLDCGATATLAMHRYGVAPNHIGLILISHLHGDHFGGLPYFILDAQLHSKRRSPLVIAGPEGTEARLKAAMEIMFPGSSSIRQKFSVEIKELRPGMPWRHHDLTVHSVEAIHASSNSALAFRLEIGEKVIAYTGDTEWFEGLIPTLKGADLLIAESYFYEKPIKFHLNYRTLMEYLPLLKPGRLLLTHMSQDMLDRLAEIHTEAAHDGLEIQI